MERLKKAVRYFYDIKTIMAGCDILGIKPDEEERMEFYIKANELNYISDTLKMIKAERRYKKDMIFSDDYEVHDIFDLEELKLTLIINGEECDQIKIDGKILEMIR